MQNKLTVGIVGAVLALGAGLVGWQSWNTHQLQQQVYSLQQQLSQQVQSPPAALPHSSNKGGLVPNQLQPQTPPGAPVNPPSQGSPFGSSPFGGDDPFAEMQRMQQDMHQRIHQMMQGFGMSMPLFDMDPFQGGSGFNSNMGFGVQPDFSFTEEGDRYLVTIKIPQGSNVEINTETRGQELTVQGKVTVEQNNQGNSGAFSSVQTQQFARTLTLPADVDVLGITHETVGDEIHINLPKQAQDGSGL